MSEARPPKPALTRTGAGLMYSHTSCVSSHENTLKDVEAVFLLFIAEIFPLKTSGSFFTTGNATYFFLILAITVALSERNKLN